MYWQNGQNIHYEIVFSRGSSLVGSVSDPSDPGLKGHGGSEASATTKTSRTQTEAKGSTPEWLTESSSTCQQCQIPREQVEKLALAACQRSGLVLKLHKPPQLEALEEDLEDSITILEDKNRIFGNPLSVDELLNPREDVDIAAEMFEDDVAIIAEVRRRDGRWSGMERSWRWTQMMGVRMMTACNPLRLCTIS
ncbi:hypothetical protein EV363DRAFT_1203092 [Boletus edulis]|nr:hypothetical protein EV363DRAFT_1203092 [Boletus edulis]